MGGFAFRVTNDLSQADACNKKGPGTPGPFDDFVWVDKPNSKPGLKGRDANFEISDDVIVDYAREHERIRICAAANDIPAVITEDQIVTGVTVHSIVARTAENQVRSITTVAATHFVVVGAPENQVRLISTVDKVLAGFALDIIAVTSYLNVNPIGLTGKAFVLLRRKSNSTAINGHLLRHCPTSGHNAEPRRAYRAAFMPIVTKD